MPISGGGKIIREVLEGVESLPLNERFTQKDIIKLTGASISSVSSYIPMLQAYGFLDCDHRCPKNYWRVKEGLLTAYENKELQLQRGVKNGEVRDGAGRISRTSAGSVEPELEEIEFDPMQVFEVMEPDDFGSLVSQFIAKKMLALEPLQAEINSLRQELRIVESQHEAHTNMIEGSIRQLREDLKTERTTTMNLREELFREKQKHIVQQETPKVYLPRKELDEHNRNIQSGGSGTSGGGLGMNRVVMHGKPHTSHVPRAVVEYKRKKKD